jgi:hypothetical protein
MGPALSNALRDFEAQAKARSAAAAQHFRDFCLRSSVEICDVPASAKGVTASWQAEGGHALRRIMFHARHNDLVVVGRAKTANGLPADFLEELLLGCGRPVLIASSAPARRRHRPVRSWCAGRRAPKRRARSMQRCRS